MKQGEAKFTEKTIPSAMITGQSYHDDGDKALEPIKFAKEKDDVVAKLNEVIDNHNELLRQLQNNRYVKVSE